MLVGGPQRGLFLACLGVGVASLLLLDLHFAPAALEAAPAARAAPAPMSSRPALAGLEPAPAPLAPAPSATATRVALPASARVPTIVARFESQSKAPTDEAAIRALATAMIEEPEVKVALEGHSDTRGGGDYNHTISLARADWVKERLVALGVSAERIETVGLGATRPLRVDEANAQAVNRRVEVRWLGR